MQILSLTDNSFAADGICSRLPQFEGCEEVVKLRAPAELEFCSKQCAGDVLVLAYLPHDLIPIRSALARLAVPPGVLALATPDTPDSVLTICVESRWGLLSDTASPAWLTVALEEVAAGRDFVDTKLRKRLCALCRSPHTLEGAIKIVDPINALKRHHQRVVYLLLHGFDVVAIGERLDLSVCSVRRYLSEAAGLLDLYGNQAIIDRFLKGAPGWCLDLEAVQAEAAATPQKRHRMPAFAVSP